MKISCQCDSNQSNAFVKKETWIDETKPYVKKKKGASSGGTELSTKGFEVTNHSNWGKNPLLDLYLYLFPHEK